MAKLDVDSSDEPSIAFYDARGGSPRAMMGVITGKPHFGLFDAEGKRRLDASLDSSGEPHITLNDGEGNPRASMATNPSGAGLTLFGSNGKPGVAMTLLPKGDKGVFLFGIGDRPLATIEVSSSEPGITLADQHGYELDLGSTDTVNVKTGEAQHTSAASIVMSGNDKDPHVIGQAP